MPPLSCAQLDAIFRSLAQIRGEAAFCSLSVPERRELGGHLFPGAEALVGAVGRALAADPALFADLPVSGEALLAQQALAARLRLLQGALLCLAQLAGDSHLKLQSDAVRTAQAVVSAVKDTPALRSGERLWRQNLALAPAYLVLHSYYGSLQRKKALRRQARQAAAHRAAPAPALVAPTPPSPWSSASALVAAPAPLPGPSAPALIATPPASPGPTASARAYAPWPSTSAASARAYAPGPSTRAPGHLPSMPMDAALPDRAPRRLAPRRRATSPRRAAACALFPACAAALVAAPAPGPGP